MLKKNRRKAVLLFILLSTISTYCWSLNSPFLLDDWPNLSPLASISGQQISVTEIIKFFDVNRSGQLGRPISLLSFALQANSWPDNPAAFKLINLSLHLINGLLIVLISRFLARTLPLTETLKTWLPLVVGGIWLIQPMHVSTVLYAVQRMTLLMACFSLLALSGYLYGREVVQKKPAAGYWIASLSLIIGGLLAVFSKENGVLIVLFIAVIECTLFIRQPHPGHWRYFLMIFVALPITVGVVYVIDHFHSFAAGHAWRNYTLTQHLLTESRILVEYLSKILLPRPDAFGLFFDDYVISTDLVTPFSTLITVVLIGMLLISAILARTSQPVFSFAVFWFFAGHLLESSIIPLELYFEHRNYLPSAGILFSACYYIAQLLQKASSPVVKNTFSGLAAIYCLGVWFICYQETTLWANPPQQALTWQKNHPTSKRANELAYQTWIKLGDPLKADSYLKNIAAIDQQDSASYLMRLETHCYINHISQQDRAMILDRLKNTHTDNATVLSAQSLISTWIAEKCPYLEVKYIEQLLDTVLANTSTHHHLSHLTSSLSLLYAAENKYPQAFDLLDKAIRRMPKATELKLLKIRWAIANQQLDDALTWIAEARKQTNNTLLRKLNFSNQLNIMENDIKIMRLRPGAITR